MVKIWENITRSFQDAEKFDDRFWRSAGAAARFSATWTMIKDWQKMKGKRRVQLRLRRSVQNLKRIPY